MSKLIATLKKTPVYPLWKKVKTWYPVKKLIRLDGNFHKWMLLKVYYPYLYKKYAKQPVDPNKVIFVEIRLPELTNSFQTLYKAVSAKDKYDIHLHFLRLSFVGRREYDKRCKAFIKDLATAKYVFANEASNVLSCVPKRSETIVTQTWHGCGAFKKFGFSTAEKIFGGSYKEQLKYPFYKNYDYVTISSPEVAWAYEEAMHLQETPEIIKPIGSSRTDVFYDQEFIGKAYEKLYQEFPQAKGKKVILYAPTFRGRVANGQAPDKLDIPLMMKELGEDYVLLTKHHPLVRVLPQIPKECSAFAKDVTNSMAIDDLLCVSDICISDYSSLIFEYSIFEKPMIFFAYDRSDYDDWRGFYYNYDEMTPGPICTENEEMIDYIKNVDTRFNRQEVIDFKYKFMRACDGHATERILNLVLGEDDQDAGDTSEITNDEICDGKTELLKELDGICKQNNISYFACSHLLTGCVHYQNFIPGEADREWDLGFLREDYDRLLPILRSRTFENGIRFTENIPPKNVTPRRVPFLEKKIKGTWYHIRLCVFEHMPDDFYERQAFQDKILKMEETYDELASWKSKNAADKILKSIQRKAKPLTVRKDEIHKAAAALKKDKRANSFQSVALHHSRLLPKERLLPLQKLPFRDMMLSCPRDVSLWTDVQDKELEAQTEAFQKLNLFVLKKFDEVCEKLGIGYFVCGGTMLGCIRNGGFIPWDDDVDCGMLREDYDRFMKEAGQYLDDRFFLQTGETEPNIPYLYSKLRLNDTECVTPFLDRWKCHHGIGIDIFPFDYIPDNEKEREAFLKEVNALAEEHLELTRQQKLVHPEEVLPPRNLKEHLNHIKYRHQRENYCKIPILEKRNAYVKTASRYNKDAKQKGLTTVASFVPSYTYIRTEDLLPYGRRPFEDIEVSVPKKPEVFLEMQYGDFQKLPPKHQQIGHKVLRWSADVEKILGTEE